MMYESIEEIPPEIRARMPDEVCELYRAAYNRLAEKESAMNLSEQARHERAHEGAMLAITTEFEIDSDGNWQRAPIGNAMDRKGPAAK